jgi:hypothetical protein
MVEQIFALSKGNEKAVEKVLLDDNLHHLHMVFNKGEGCRSTFPTRMCILRLSRGKLSTGLNNQKMHEYEAGALIKIPYQTKMNVKHLYGETLEANSRESARSEKLTDGPMNAYTEYF